MLVIAGVPIVIIAALLAALACVVVLVRGSRSTATRRVSRSIWCPLHDRSFAAEVEEKTWDGQRVDVRSCAAFSPPTAITCEKSCRRIRKRPRTATQPAWPSFVS